MECDIVTGDILAGDIVCRCTALACLDPASHPSTPPLNQHNPVRHLFTTSTNLVLTETPHTQYSLTHFTIEITLTLNIQNTLRIPSATSNIRGNKYHFQDSIILALV